MSETLLTIAKGFASLIGAGDYITGDQMSVLNANLSGLKADQAVLFQNMTVSALSSQQAEIHDIVNWIQANNAVLEETSQLQNTLVMGSIGKMKIFSVLMALIVIMLVFITLYK